MSVFVPRNRCEFCGRRVEPNLPDRSDQWIYVGPLRGQDKVIACMSRQGLKPGRMPCGWQWRHIDELFRKHEQSLEVDC